MDNDLLITELTAVVPGLLYLFDIVSRRNIYVNPQSGQLLGYSDHEVVAMGAEFFERRLHPDDAPVMQRHFEQMHWLPEGRGAEVEYRLQHRDGSWRWFLSRDVVYQRGVDGRAEQILGIATDITERKRVEEQLRAREAHLQLAMAASCSIAFEWDVVRDRVLRLQSVEAALPPTLEAFDTLEGVARVVHPDDRDVFRANVRAALDSGTGAYHSEHRIVRPDGAVRWLEERGRVDFDVEHRPVRLIGISQDVTERKQARQALDVSEQRLRFALDAAQAGTFDINLDPDAHPVITSGVRHLFGFAADERPLTGDFLCRVHKEDRERVARAIAHSAQTGEAHYVEYRIVRPDASEIWVASKAQAITGLSGRVEHLLGVLVDISERKRAEGESRKNDARFRTISEALPGLVFVQDSQGRNMFVNRGFCEYIRCGPEELLDDRWKPLIHPEDFNAFWSRWTAAVAEGRLFECEYRLRRHDGVWRWHIVRSAPQKNPDGTISEWIGTATDIHDRKRAEEALKEADRRKDEFLAMLAHELRNPLAPIRNAVHILRLVAPKEPRLVGAHDMIERQVNHLVRLVDDLLDVSRVSRGKIQLQKELLELSVVVRQAVETSRPLIDARRHELTLTMPIEPIRLDGDLTRLSQVVSNLLNNAAKYTDAGGRIRLSVERVGEGQHSEAVIRVRDNGRGIDPRALLNLFELFYQVDRNLDRSEGGLGIGLSLVKSLVEMHGGRVEASSAGRGTGSEFIVRLPCMPEDRPALRADDSPAHEQTSNGLRILVVDDNRDSADTMATLLELNGHHAFTAYDGKQAVEMALAERPDVVLLDIGLPHLNGYQACQAIRQGGLTQALLVAMTGYGQDEDRRLSREAGFDAHLVKPVEVEMIRELLGRLTMPRPR